MANIKKMMALQSMSEAAGLAVACADADEQAGQSSIKRNAAVLQPSSIEPPAKLSKDMTWAEPKFRDTFESTVPMDAASPKYVLSTALAQWLTSRAGYKIG